MKRASFALSVATLLACAPPPAPTAAAPPRPGAVACEPVRLPSEGIVGCMPGAYTATPGGGAGSPRGVVADLVTPTYKARFSLTRERRSDPEEIVKEASPSRFHRVDATRAIEEGGFTGRVIDGLVDERTRAVTKLVAVGDSLYTAEVRWDAGETPEPHLVSVFLASFHVNLPWRVHVSAEGAYSVALPEPAAGAEEETTEDGTQMLVHGRGLGGIEERTYAVVVTHLPPGDTRTTEDIFEDGMARLLAQPGRVVLQSGEAFMGGLPGHDVTFDGDTVFMRLRMFVANRRMYALVAGAKHLEALSGVEATRFLDSFQALSP